jgi:valyl-tRNA synthetase
VCWKEGWKISAVGLGEKITILANMDKKPPQSASAVLDEVTVYLPLKGLLDLDKRWLKSVKNYAALQEQKRLEGKLNNPGLYRKHRRCCRIRK